jgi:hypothetical protein
VPGKKAPKKAVVGIKVLPEPEMKQQIKFSKSMRKVNKQISNLKKLKQAHLEIRESMQEISRKHPDLTGEELEKEVNRLKKRLRKNKLENIKDLKHPLKEYGVQTASVVGGTAASLITANPEFLALGLGVGGGAEFFKALYDKEIVWNRQLGIRQFKATLHDRTKWASERRSMRNSDKEWLTRSLKKNKRLLKLDKEMKKSKDIGFLAEGSTEFKNLLQAKIKYHKIAAENCDTALKILQEHRFSLTEKSK